MPELFSALWQKDIPADSCRLLGDILDRAGRQVEVFFRADDIGRPDGQFDRLMRLFSRHRAPLCLAVVPAWLDQNSWREMQRHRVDSRLWCWHQHGWNHRNHEHAGKKCEFGPDRERTAVGMELSRGRQLLEDLLGDLFLPVFTPPWNRCSQATLDMLFELDFVAISRSASAKPPAPAGLPDLAVNVDLHTRRETDCRKGWRNLLAEIELAAASGRIGFMIHHQRMNDTALAFLDLLLTELAKRPSFACCTFRELLPPITRRC